MDFAEFNERVAAGLRALEAKGYVPDAFIMPFQNDNFDGGKILGLPVYFVDDLGCDITSDECDILPVFSRMIQPVHKNDMLSFAFRKAFNEYN